MSEYFNWSCCISWIDIVVIMYLSHFDCYYGDERIYLRD